jgi:outer membrane protein assembly factor BamB
MAMPAVLLAAGAALAHGQEWNQWRGPDRNGVAAKAPALSTNWPAAGPPRIWLSEETFPKSGDKSGGAGSPVVADGRVYCLVMLGRREAVQTRTVTSSTLKKLGWPSREPPTELLAAVEAARTSPERAALKPGPALKQWVAAWLRAHLKPDQKKPFSNWAKQRLAQGEGALDAAALRKLAAVRDKPFPGQTELDAWFEEQAIPDAVRKAVNGKLVKSANVCNDMVACLSAETGKTLWKTVFTNAYPDGKIVHGRFPASGTPCVADGKCYAMGMDGDVYCLDAATGGLVWQNCATGGLHNSFAVMEGVAIVQGRQGACGFDASTGKLLWRRPEIKASWKGHHASPGAWRHNGRSYPIFRGLRCVDPGTGRILWTAKGDRWERDCSPAVAGDIAAVWDKAGVVCFSLGLSAARMLWKVPFGPDWAASPVIHDGHVYAIGGKRGICVNIASGKVRWKQALPVGSYASPVLADGKLLLQGHFKKSSYGDGSLVMMEATPQAARIIAKAPIRQALCTSPAFSNGRLYCRLGRRLACFDLTERSGDKAGAR